MFLPLFHCSCHYTMIVFFEFRHQIIEKMLFLAIFMKHIFFMKNTIVSCKTFVKTYIFYENVAETSTKG